MNWKKITKNRSNWPEKWQEVLGYNSKQRHPVAIVCWFEGSDGTVYWVWNGASGPGTPQPTMFAEFDLPQKG